MRRRYWRPPDIISFYVVTQYVLLARGQTNDATCDSEHSWMENELKQSPCTVASCLEKQCVVGDWTVPALNNSGPYDPPTLETSNVCRCNPVTYNLISACSVCQGGEVGSWTEYIQNCPSNVTDQSTYPLPVPSDTTIPKWAESLPDNTSGYFSASNAYALSGQTDKPNNMPRILAISLSIAGALIVLAIVAVLLRQRRHTKSRAVARNRPARAAPAVGPASHRYSGIEPSPSVDKASLWEPPTLNPSALIGSPQSASISLYDPPSSPGHGSPPRRPTSLHRATYPLYPSDPPHDMYDLPDIQSTHSLASLIADSASDSAHSIRYPPWSEPGRRYEGIMKLERIAPQPHPL